MKSFILLAAAALSLVIVQGCNTSTQPDPVAQELTLAQLRQTPGFAWFDGEVSSYNADAITVSQISAEYQAKKQKVYMFVNPSCSCTGTKKRFPWITRILNDAGVSENDIVVVSMQSESNKHPYMNRFTVRGLPSFFITKDEATVFAIQTVKQTLYANPLDQPDKTAEADLLENILLDGFKR